MLADASRVVHPRPAAPSTPSVGGRYYAGGSVYARSLRPAIIYKDNESEECEHLLRRHR